MSHLRVKLLFAHATSSQSLIAEEFVRNLLRIQKRIRIAIKGENL